MDFSNKFNKNLFSFFLITVISVAVSSCGKDNKNEPQGLKNDTSNSNTKDEKPKGSDAAISDKYIIWYKLEGKKAGTMELIRSGDKIRQNIDFNIKGTKGYNVVYVLNNLVYTVVDIDGGKVGMKTDLAKYNSSRYTGETIVDLKDFEKFLDTIKVTGTETIIGYDCDIYEIAQFQKLYVHKKKYILRIVDPQLTATATQLDLYPEISKKDFELPANVDFKEPKEREVMSQAMKDSLAKIFRNKK